MIADYILDPLNENGWMTLNEVCTVWKVAMRARTLYPILIVFISLTLASYM